MFFDDFWRFWTIWGAQSHPESFLELKSAKNHCFYKVFIDFWLPPGGAMLLNLDESGCNWMDLGWPEQVPLKNKLSGGP